MNLIAKRYATVQSGLSLDADARSLYEDLIDLSIGDTDFVTDGRIIDVAMADAHAGHTRYGFPQGDPALIEAIRRAWLEDYGQDVPREEVLITASSCLGMAQALLAMLDPGDEVLVLAPYFALYREQIELAGGVCVEVDCDPATFLPDVERLGEALTPRTRALIVNNPCNPTGAFYDRQTLEALGRFCEAHDLAILSDEIYTRYLFSGEYVPMRTLPGLAPRVVTLNSFSKNFMMTGWRVGFILCDPALRQTIQRIAGGLIYTAPSISQRAAIEALRLREDIERLYVARYLERMHFAAERIRQIPYMTLAEPQGTFYLFPGIQRTGLSASAFCAQALRQAHVLLSPGHVFGRAGEGHVRIAVTQPTEKLAEAFGRLSCMKFD